MRCLFSIQGHGRLRWDEERAAVPLVGQLIEHQGRSYVVVTDARATIWGEIEVAVLSVAPRINGEQRLD